MLLRLIWSTPMFQDKSLAVVSTPTYLLLWLILLPGLEETAASLLIISWRTLPRPRLLVSNFGNG
jgi:hypothetical protein